jgi:hypothetical protein
MLGAPVAGGCGVLGHLNRDDFFYPMDFGEFFFDGRHLMGYIIIKLL